MRVESEKYGSVALAQLQMYRSRSVSVEDHEELVAEFGSDWAAICSAVAARSAVDGVYRRPLFGRPV